MPPLRDHARLERSRMIFETVFMPLNYVDSIARAMLDMKDRSTFEEAKWALFEKGIVPRNTPV